MKTKFDLTKIEWIDGQGNRWDDAILTDTLGFVKNNILKHGGKIIKQEKK